MTKITVSTAGGAMPERALTVSNLINQETGELNLWVLNGLARREALLTYGVISPRGLRASLKMYADRLPQLQCAWRERHGLAVEYATATAFGPAREGVRRSAF